MALLRLKHIQLPNASLVVGTGAGTAVALAPGSDNQVLTIVSGSPTWKFPGALYAGADKALDVSSVASGDTLVLSSPGPANPITISSTYAGGTIVVDPSPGTLGVDPGYSSRVGLDTDVANVGWVRSQLHSQPWKRAVRVATTAASDVSSYTYQPANEGIGHEPLVWTGVTAAPTIDGVTLVDGDRLLIKDAGDARGNGIFRYVAAAQGFVRVEEADNDPDTTLGRPQVSGGLVVYVADGAVNGESVWVLTSPKGAATLGTDALVFELLASTGGGAGGPTAGVGIAVSGSQVSVDWSNASTATTIAPADLVMIRNAASQQLAITRADLLGSADVFASDASTPPASWQIGYSASTAVNFSLNTVTLNAVAVNMFPTSTFDVVTTSGGITLQAGGTGTVAISTNDANVNITTQGTGNFAVTSFNDVYLDADTGTGRVRLQGQNVYFAPAEVQFTTDAVAQTFTIESVRAGNSFVAAVLNTNATNNDAQLSIGTARGVKMGGGPQTARPSAPTAGVLRFNSDNGLFEYYDGTQWQSIPNTTTGGGTVTSVDVQPGGDGLTTSGGPITTAGTITVSLANDLAAVEALATTGFAVRTAADTWTTRTIQGSAGRISVTNGDGVAGNPTLDLETTGVVAGTYTKLTVDGYGRVTSGTTASISELAVPTADVSWANFKLTNLATPVADTDAATKAYVDSVAAGLDWKAAVRVKDTAPADTGSYTYNAANEPTGLVWTGVTTAPTWDGVTLTDGDRILITESTEGRGRGIFTYDATGQGFRRAPDADNTPGNEVSDGMAVFVTQGVSFAGSGWVMTAPLGVATLGTDTLVFTQFNAATVYTAGTGIDVTGTTISTDWTNATTITTTADSHLILVHDGTGQKAITRGNLLGSADITMNSPLRRLVFPPHSSAGNGVHVGDTVLEAGLEFTTSGMYLVQGGELIARMAFDDVQIFNYPWTFFQHQITDSFPAFKFSPDGEFISSPATGKLRLGTGTGAGNAYMVLSRPSSSTLSVVFQSTDGIQLPSGTTAQRPSGVGFPPAGTLRYNTDTNKFEYWNGSSWLEIAAGSGFAKLNDVGQTGTIYADTFMGHDTDVVFAPYEGDFNTGVGVSQGLGTGISVIGNSIEIARFENVGPSSNNVVLAGTTTISSGSLVLGVGSTGTIDVSAYGWKLAPGSHDLVIFHGDTEHLGFDGNKMFAGTPIQFDANYPTTNPAIQFPTGAFITKDASGILHLSVGTTGPTIRIDGNTGELIWLDRIGGLVLPGWNNEARSIEAVSGTLYWDNTAKNLETYDGSSWRIHPYAGGDTNFNNLTVNTLTANTEVTSPVNTVLAGSLDASALTNANIGGTITIANPITVTGAPVGSSNQTVTKRYVDEWPAWKQPVRVKDTAAGDTSSYTYNPASENGPTPLVWTGVTTAPTWDGVTLQNGDRILITNATDQRGNGIFTYDSAAQGFRRAADADNNAFTKVGGGMAVTVVAGTANAGSVWVLTSPQGAVTLGTDNLVFQQIAGAGGGGGGGGSGGTQYNEVTYAGTNPIVGFFSATPTNEDSTWVYVNGVALRNIEFAIQNGTDLFIDEAQLGYNLVNGDKIWARYNPPSDPAKYNEATYAGSNPIVGFFTTAPSSQNDTWVYLNGVALRNPEFAIQNGTDLFIDEAQLGYNLVNGDKIWARYR